MSVQGGCGGRKGPIPAVAIKATSGSDGKVSLVNGHTSTSGSDGSGCNGQAEEDGYRVATQLNSLCLAGGNVKSGSSEKMRKREPETEASSSRSSCSQPNNISSCLPSSSSPKSEPTCHQGLQDELLISSQTESSSSTVVTSSLPVVTSPEPVKKEVVKSLSINSDIRTTTTKTDKNTSSVFESEGKVAIEAGCDSCPMSAAASLPPSAESGQAVAVPAGGGDAVTYHIYQSELNMPDIMRLIQKDLSEPYSIYTYRYFIHNWPNLCFMARVNGECVGAIVCKLDYHKKVVKRGYIAMLAVDSKFRKRAIGSTLVQKAIQAMDAQEADEVVLETEITNKPALRLYENLGFVRDKRLFRYYLNGVDALRLKLWLR